MAVLSLTRSKISLVDFIKHYTQHYQHGHTCDIGSIYKLVIHVIEQYSHGKQKHPQHSKFAVVHPNHTRQPQKCVADIYRRDMSTRPDIVYNAGDRHGSEMIQKSSCIIDIKYDLKIIMDYTPSKFVEL